MNNPVLPRDLLIDENIRDKYIRPINQFDEKPFKKMTDIYLMAAVLGYRNNKRLKSAKSGSIVQYRDLSDEQKLVMSTLAVAENKHNTDILLPENGKDMFKIVEEYANAGAPLLHDMVMIKRDNKKSYEESVWEEIKKIKDKG